MACTFSLLFLGGFVARYYRHLNPLWFKMHRPAQMIGLISSWIGMIFGFIANNDPKSTHGIIGLIVMVFGTLQPINAYFRYVNFVVLSFFGLFQKGLYY